jgi:phosphoribosylaminoimidazole carboxylase (NCAIR synthetase)
MVNILGTNLPRIQKEVPNFPEYWKIHLYGKRGNLEASRKMGQLTIKTGQPDQEVTRIKTIFPE